MKKNVDARIIRTKEAIRQALIRLIEEKGFEELTVRDIANEANINRGTFYTHYEDKHDLIKECQRELMEGMSQIAKEKLKFTLSKEQNKDKANMASPAITIFEFLNENKVIMKALLGPNGDVTFQMKLRDFIWKTLFEDEKQQFFKKEALLAPEEYVASYIAFAHIGVIQQWLANGSVETPQEMARILSTININGPFAAAGLKI